MPWKSKAHKVNLNHSMKQTNPPAMRVKISNLITLTTCLTWLTTSNLWRRKELRKVSVNTLLIVSTKKLVVNSRKVVISVVVDWRSSTNIFSQDTWIHSIARKEWDLMSRLPGKVAKKRKNLIWLVRSVVINTRTLVVFTNMFKTKVITQQRRRWKRTSLRRWTFA